MNSRGRLGIRRHLWNQWHGIGVKDCRAVSTDENEIPPSIQAQKTYLDYFMIHQMNSKWTKYMLNIFSSYRIIRNRSGYVPNFLNFETRKERLKEFL